MVTPATHPGRAQAGFRGDVGECAVAIVAVEPIAGAFGSRAEARTAKHQDVEPAVVIVIEKSDAAADGFEDVALGVDAAVDGGRRQTGRARDVGELRIERQPGAFSLRLWLDVAGGHSLRQQVFSEVPPGDHHKVESFSVG